MCPRAQLIDERGATALGALCAGLQKGFDTIQIAIIACLVQREALFRGGVGTYRYGSAGLDGLTGVGRPRVRWTRAASRCA